MTDTFPKLKMPAEWQPQSAIWLSWPHNLETWPANLAEAQIEFIELMASIAATQPVCLMVSGPAQTSVEMRLDSIPKATRQNISLLDIPTDDAWARDYAPTFVNNDCGESFAIDWNYNAWGEKYAPFDQDQKVAQRIADHLEIPCLTPEICYEGGAIEVNDSGLLLTTRSCALDPKRNRGMSLEQIEQTLHAHLGTTQAIWLPGDALAGDDTDGHIDQLARFTNDETIVYAWTHDIHDPQLAPLEKNRCELQRQLSISGRGHFRLISLPIPGPIEFHNRRIPASYCNFLITNQLVLVPQFDQPEDKQALEILAPLFPTRDVIGLASLNLSVGLGSFHCLSQQQ